MELDAGMGAPKGGLNTIMAISILLDDGNVSVDRFRKVWMKEIKCWCSLGFLFSGKFGGGRKMVILMQERKKFD